MRMGPYPEVTPMMSRNISAWLIAIMSVTAWAEPAKDAPAPAVDRVGFPQGYQASFQVLRTVTHKEEGKIVTVYGNALAASVTNASQLPYPYGSVIVMESTGARKGADGKVELDAKGELHPEKVLGLHVMRREKGFGEAYRDKRSGEWEYVEYRADGSYLTPTTKSAACSACHVKAGPEKDFVFQGRLASAAKK